MISESHQKVSKLTGTVQGVTVDMVKRITKLQLESGLYMDSTCRSSSVGKAVWLAMSSWARSTWNPLVQLCSRIRYLLVPAVLLFSLSMTCKYTQY